MDYTRIPDWTTPITGVLFSEGTPTFTTVISDLDVKAALRLGETYDDALLGTLIDSATGHLEQSMNTRLAQRTMTYAFPYWSTNMVLPINPATAITGVTYLDVNYTRQTLDPTVYQLVQQAGFPQLSQHYNKLFPNIVWEDNCVQVSVTVGYPDAASIPVPLKQALIVNVCDLYLNPDRPLTATANVDWLKAPFSKTDGWIA